MGRHLPFSLPLSPVGHHGTRPPKAQTKRKLNTRHVPPPNFSPHLAGLWSRHKIRTRTRRHAAYERKKPHIDHANITRDAQPGCRAAMRTRSGTGPLFGQCVKFNNAREHTATILPPAVSSCFSFLPPATCLLPPASARLPAPTPPASLLLRSYPLLPLLPLPRPLTPPPSVPLPPPSPSSFSSPRLEENACFKRMGLDIAWVARAHCMQVLPGHPVPSRKPRLMSWTDLKHVPRTDRHHMLTIDIHISISISSSMSISTYISIFIQSLSLFSETPRCP